MERLLADAEKFSGIKYDISSLSDVYEAIHVIQQEMGITGTTAKEAGDTISGSFGSLSAAWENLITGFADDSADLSLLIDNVITAAEGSFNNLLPIIEQSISGLSDFITEIAPQITERLPQLANELVPPLLETANDVINTLVAALPTTLNAIIDVVPGVITDISQTVISLLPEIGQLGIDLIVSLSDGITGALPMLIPTAADAVYEICDTLTNPDSLSNLLDAALDLTLALGEGLVNSVPKLADATTKLVTNLVEFILDPDNLTNIAETALRLVVALGEGLVSGAFKLVEGAATLVKSVTDTILSGDWSGVGKDVDLTIADSILDNSDTVTDAWNGMLGTLDGMLGTSLQDMAKEIEAWAFDVGKQIYAALHPEEANELRSIELKGSISNDIDDFLRSGYSPEEALREAKSLNLISTDDFDVYDRYLKTDINLDTVKARQAELEAIQNQAIQAEEDFKKRATYIPTEALRQMEGIEPYVLQNVPESLKKGAQKLTEELSSTVEQAGAEGAKAVEKAATKAEKITKDTLTFATKEIGEYKDLGIAKQLGQVLTEEQKKLDLIAQTVWSETKEVAERTIKNDELGYDKQAELWRQMRDQFVENSDQWIAANDKILEAQRKSNKEQEELAKKKLEEELKLSQKSLKEGKQAVERKISAERLGNAEQAELWKQYRDTFVENTENWLDINDRYISAKNKADDEAAAAEIKRQKEQDDAIAKSLQERQNAYTKFTSQINNINKEIDDAQQKYANAVQTEAQKIYNSFGLFDEVPERIAMSGEKLIANLDNQIIAMEKFQGDLDKLSAKGVSADLVSELAAMGDSAADELEALLNLTDEELTKYNDLFEKKHSISDTFAKDRLEPIKEQTEQTIAELMESETAIAKEYSEKYGEAFLTGVIDAVETGASTMVEKTSEAVSKAWTETFGEDTTLSLGTIEPEMSANMTVNNDNHYDFHINGIQYQNITQLAQAVSNEFQKLLNRRNVGYAGT